MSFNSLDLFLLKCIHMFPYMPITIDGDFLFDSQSKVINRDFTFVVVNNSLSLDLLVRQIHVLIEFAFETGFALIYTAPSCDFVRTLLINASLKLWWNFSDYQNLFVLDIFDLILLSITNNFDVILDLGLRLGLDIMLLEQNR